MIIKAENGLTENAPKTYLSFNEVAGTTIFRWKNPSGFGASWAIQIGETAEEQTEVFVLGTATPAGTAGTITGTSLYAHSADTPVYAIKYNQVVFERAIAGTAGTATPMTGGTVNLQTDNKYTIFDDTTGDPTYAYRVKFRNSVLTTTSSESDWITSTGYEAYTLSSIRERIKAKLWDASFLVDSDIDDWINEWLEIMTNSAIDVNEDYAIGTANIAFSGTAQEGTITSSDFKQVRRAWYTENGTDIYKMSKQEYTSFYPEEEFSETHPYYYMKGDNIIGRNPHDSSGTIQLSYYKLNSRLDDDGDSLPVPMRGYSASFVKWGLAQAYRKDNKPNEAISMEQQAQIDLQNFKKELTPRNKSEQSFIDIVEDWGESDTGQYR